MGKGLKPAKTAMKAMNQILSRYTRLNYFSNSAVGIHTLRNAGSATRVSGKFI